VRYLLMIYQDEVANAKWRQEELAAEYEAYNAFGPEAQKIAPMQAGEALLPTRTATTVRVRDGKTLTTDGPFAETKEQLGGFYLFDCKDLDQAIQLAATMPAATDGSLAVRPVMEFEYDLLRGK